MFEAEKKLNGLWNGWPYANQQIGLKEYDSNEDGDVVNSLDDSEIFGNGEIEL